LSCVFFLFGDCTASWPLSSGSPDVMSVPDFSRLSDVLQQQLEAQQAMMTQQLELQRQQMNQQLQLQQQFLQDQLDVLKSAYSTHLSAKDAASSVTPTESASGVCDVDKLAQHELHAKAGGPRLPEEEAQPKLKAVSNPLSERVKDDTAVQNQRKLWVRSCGLHTVEKWVLSYRKHPAGWAALLMIHGIPEVTSRLRTKVQNYAVFSGLFLGGTIKAMTGRLPVCHNDALECDIRKRVYAYSLGFSMVSHVSCILLAMAFHNALNEAARDSDVYRMFARGKGFRATMKVELTFFLGAFCCLIGTTAVVQETVGWDFVAWMVFLSSIACVLYKHTMRLLFSTASICSYWREELGGKPDVDDPYDLAVPAACFKKQLVAGNAGWEEVLEQYDEEVEMPPTTSRRTTKFVTDILDMW